MNLKKLLLTAAAAAVLTSAGAGMAMADRWDNGGNNGWHHGDRGDHRGDRDRYDGDRGHDRNWRDHDRYWRADFGDRGYVDRDRVFFELRRHHFNRFVGDPYWFNGRYVVRTYDRWGNVVIVEVNPYTGGFVGEVRF